MMLSFILLSTLVNAIGWIWRSKPKTFTESLFWFAVGALSFSAGQLVIGGNIQTIVRLAPCFVVGDIIAYILIKMILPSIKATATN